MGDPMRMPADPPAAASALVALFREVLPEDVARDAEAAGLAVDLADLLSVAMQLREAICGLQPGVSRLDEVVHSLNVVYQQALVHAPYHLQSLSESLPSLLERLEDAPPGQR